MYDTELLSGRDVDMLLRYMVWASWEAGILTK